MGGNTPPDVTNPGAQTNAEGNTVSLQIVASDVDLPPQTLTYSASNLPGGLSIDPVSGLISGNINYHAAAQSPYNVTVSVTDGITPVSQSFTWTVTNAASGLCGSDPTLVGCWPMEEGSGAVVIDSTSFGNDGNITGSPTWVTGKVGTYALILNGTTQYATIPDSNSLDIASNRITLATWIKPEQTTTQNLIKKAVNSNTNGYELSLAAAGSAADQKYFVRFNQTESGDHYRVNSTINYLNNDTWVHVAATYDGTTIKLYINGVLNNSLTPIVPFTIAANSLPLGIGADSNWWKQI